MRCTVANQDTIFDGKWKFYINIESVDQKEFQKRY
jgi:hypothetical protein